MRPLAETPTPGQPIELTPSVVISSIAGLAGHMLRTAGALGGAMDADMTVAVGASSDKTPLPQAIYLDWTDYCNAKCFFLRT
jgi:hypothetical protein